METQLTQTPVVPFGQIGQSLGGDAFGASSSDESENLSFLTKYISEFTFAHVNCLASCQPITDIDLWDQFISKSVALIATLAARISEVSTVKTFTGNTRTSRGSSLQQPLSSSIVVPESLNALNATVEGIQKESKKLQQLLNVQSTFWKMEEEAIRQLWDGNYATSKPWRSRLCALTDRSKQLDQLFQKKKRELAPNDHDIDFCLKQKQVVRLTCTIWTGLNAEKSNAGERDESSIEESNDGQSQYDIKQAKEAAFDLKKLYEEEAGIHIQFAGLVENDQRAFDDWEGYYWEVRNTLNQLYKIKEEINVFSYIYYHSECHLGVTLDYNRLKKDKERINEYYEGLKNADPLIEDSKKIHYQAKIVSLEQMKQQIAGLRLEISGSLEKLNTDYASKAQSEAVLLFQSLDAFMEEELEENESLKGKEKEGKESMRSKSFDEHAFVAARSEIRQEASDLLKQMAALIGDITVCVFNKHRLAESFLQLEDVREKFKKIEERKTNDLNNLKNALEEAQKRGNILAIINKNIHGSTLKLRELIPDFNEIGTPPSTPNRELTLLELPAEELQEEEEGVKVMGTEQRRDADKEKEEGN